jgi:hypothetical protein
MLFLGQLNSLALSRIKSRQSRVGRLGHALHDEPGRHARSHARTGATVRGAGRTWS